MVRLQRKQENQVPPGNIATTALTGGLNTFFSGSSGVLWSSVSEKNRNSGLNSAPSFLSAGNNLSIDAGRDVGIVGSYVQAGKDLSLEAGRDVNIIPGRETYSSEYTKTTKKAGLWNSLGEGGISTFAGLKMEEQGVKRTGDYTAGSFLSAGRDVTIKAGQDINQSGSHIAAGRDAIIDAGRDWNMLAAQDHETLNQYVKTVEAGVSASVKQNVSGTVRELVDLPQNAMAGKGGSGYSALTAAGSGLRAVDSVSGSLSTAISASVSAGSSYSRTDYHAGSSTARPSSVTAGRDVEAVTGRDITIEGGLVSGGRDVILDAGRDLNIVAARNSGDSSMSSESGGASAGLKAVAGSGGLAGGINVSANAAGSHSNDKYGSHTNAQIVGGDTLYTSSGRDTTIAGAHLEGDKVWMDVGGDLTVASLQDSYESESSSWNAGLDVTAGYGVNVSGSLGVGSGSASSSWVGEQTSIVGKSEVDIYVEGNTHLKGSVIATEKGGDLTLDTGTLTYEEIHDSSNSSDWHAGISGGINVDGGFDKPGWDKGAWDMKPIDYTSGDSATAPYIPKSGEAGFSSSTKEGVLRPTVTEGTIIVREDPDADLSGLNRDIEKAREVTKDEEKHLDVYVSPGAVEEVLDGFGGIAESLEKYSETLSYLNEQAKLAFDGSLKESTKTIAYELLKQGYTVEEVKNTLNATDGEGVSLAAYLGGIELAANTSNEMWMTVRFPNTVIEGDPATGLFITETPAQYVITMLGNVASMMEVLTPEQQQIAFLSLDVILTGPIKALLNQAKDQVLEWTGISGAIGEQIAKV